MQKDMIVSILDFLQMKTDKTSKNLPSSNNLVRNYNKALIRRPFFTEVLVDITTFFRFKRPQTRFKTKTSAPLQFKIRKLPIQHCNPKQSIPFPFFFTTDRQLRQEESMN